MSPIAARKKTIIWMIAAIVLAVSSIALGAGLIVSHNSLTDTRNQLTDMKANGTIPLHSNPNETQ